MPSGFSISRAIMTPSPIKVMLMGISCPIDSRQSKIFSELPKIYYGKASCFDKKLVIRHRKPIDHFSIVRLDFSKDGLVNKHLRKSRK
jgi:hypothetical protein